MNGLLYFSFYLMLFWICTSGMEKNAFRLHSPSARLQGHPIIITLPQVSLIRCAMVCASNHSHQAFNYNPGAMLCEILAKNERNLSGTLTKPSDYNYYVRFSANRLSCSSNPCLYGSRCWPTPDGLDYQCRDCPPYLGGKNCGDLNCDIYQCRLFNDTVYFSVQTGHFWKRASNTCASLGMTLAMPKEKESNAFLVDFMKSVYGNNSKVLAWIGLSSNGSNWIWVDGSPLGSYVWGNESISNYSSGYGVTFYVNGQVSTWHPKTLEDYGYSFVCQRPIYQPPSCLLNPCLYGSRCMANKSAGYSCQNCPKYFRGKNCAELNCGNITCFQINGVLYMVLGAVGSWSAANSACQAEGMTMAMLKDQPTNDYVTGQLEQSYGRNQSVLFWLGLKTVDNSTWQWVDGSTLGKYTGNRPDFKSYVVQQCGSLWVYSSGEMDWRANDCGGSPSLQYYALCQKTFFVPSN